MVQLDLSLPEVKYHHLTTNFPGLFFPLLFEFPMTTYGDTTATFIPLSFPSQPYQSLVQSLAAQLEINKRAIQRNEQVAVLVSSCSGPFARVVAACRISLSRLLLKVTRPLLPGAISSGCFSNPSRSTYLLYHPVILLAAPALSVDSHAILLLNTATSLRLHLFHCQGESPLSPWIPESGHPPFLRPSLISGLT